MILYTNIMPRRFAGYTIGPLVLIRPGYKADVGLHAHEAVHVAQFWSNPLMGLFYMFSKKARLRYEVEAFRAQLNLSPGREQRFAGFLATNYGLELSTDEALALLTAPPPHP